MHIRELCNELKRDCMLYFTFKQQRAISISTRLYRKHYKIGWNGMEREFVL